VAVAPGHDARMVALLVADGLGFSACLAAGSLIPASTALLMLAVGVGRRGASGSFGSCRLPRNG
jgi:hypothetical protein